MTDRLEELKSALKGKYEIERELGHGGMATVYLADDVKHERQVAVKVLRPDLAAALGPDRFLARYVSPPTLRTRTFFRCTIRAKPRGFSIT